MRETLKRTPPWRICIRRLAPRKTGWRCPYCGNELLVKFGDIECRSLCDEFYDPTLPEHNGLIFGFEIYCSNPECRYDKVVALVFYPPDVIVPKMLSHFETDIRSAG